MDLKFCKVHACLCHAALKLLASWPRWFWSKGASFQNFEWNAILCSGWMRTLQQQRHSEDGSAWPHLPWSCRTSGSYTNAASFVLGLGLSASSAGLVTDRPAPSMCCPWLRSLLTPMWREEPFSTCLRLLTDCCSVCHDASVRRREADLQSGACRTFRQ